MGANFSPCKKYRYSLWRTWDQGKGHVMWIGLNPSTADETQNDPTVRRCIGFAQRWGYGGIYMMNLFAFRATDPKVMQAQTDPVGPGNDEHLAAYAMNCKIIVAAWGAFDCTVDRGAKVINHLMLFGITTLHCLGQSKNGHPKHPLYVPYSQPLVEWRMK